MEPNRLDQIREQLETELELADAEVGRLKAELAAATKDHKAIKDALQALGKNAAPTRKKPSVKKADMHKAVLEQLRDQPSPVPANELDAALRDHFTRKGCSLTGFSLRLKEVLGGDNITNTPEGVILNSVAAASS